jgi:hypothetical protein
MDALSLASHTGGRGADGLFLWEAKQLPARPGCREQIAMWQNLLRPAAIIRPFVRVRQRGGRIRRSRRVTLRRPSARSPGRKPDDPDPSDHEAAA